MWVWAEKVVTEETWMAWKMFTHANAMSGMSAKCTPVVLMEVTSIPDLPQGGRKHSAPGNHFPSPSQITPLRARELPL